MISNPEKLTSKFLTGQLLFLASLAGNYREDVECANVYNFVAMKNAFMSIVIYDIM